MNKSRFALALVCGLAVAGWFGFRLWPTDEKVILSRLADLGEALSKQKPEGIIVQTIEVNSASRFFATNVFVDLSGFDAGGLRRAPQVVQGRTDIQLGLHEVRKQFRRFEVEFVDALVEMEQDKKTATVLASALYRGEMFRGDRGRPVEIEGAQEVKIEFRRTGHLWEIARVTTYKTLQ